MTKEERLMKAEYHRLMSPPSPKAFSLRCFINCLFNRRFSGGFFCRFYRCIDRLKFAKVQRIGYVELRLRRFNQWRNYQCLLSSLKRENQRIQEENQWIQEVEREFQEQMRLYGVKRECDD